MLHDTLIDITPEHKAVDESQGSTLSPNNPPAPDASLLTTAHCLLPSPRPQPLDPNPSHEQPSTPDPDSTSPSFSPNSSTPPFPPSTSATTTTSRSPNSKPG